MSDAYDDYQNLIEDRNQLLEHNEQLRARVSELEAALAKREALAGPDAYLQRVPDHCDRVVWRNQYWMLDEKQLSTVLTHAPEAKREAVAVQAISEHDWRAMQEADALSFARGWNACLNAYQQPAQKEKK